MRATVVRADGTGRRPLVEELSREKHSLDAVRRLVPPTDKLAVIGRGWESAENGKWEEEHKTFSLHNRRRLGSSTRTLLDLATGKATHLTAVERVSSYNIGLFFWPGDPTRLGFQALIDGNSHPFRMDRDGKNKRDLTKTRRSSPTASALPGRQTHRLPQEFRCTWPTPTGRRRRTSRRTSRSTACRSGRRTESGCCSWPDNTTTVTRTSSAPTAAA